MARAGTFGEASARCDHPGASLPAFIGEQPRSAMVMADPRKTRVGDFIIGAVLVATALLPMVKRVRDDLNGESELRCN